MLIGYVAVAMPILLITSYHSVFSLDPSFLSSPFLLLLSSEAIVQQLFDELGLQWDSEVCGQG